MATPTRRSLANCRRMLAKRLHSLTLVTTTSLAPDSTSIVSTDLALALGDSNRYRNSWVYVYDGAQAGNVRKVGDLALTTSSGQLKISPIAFPAPIANGVNVEIHRRLPPTTMDGYNGLGDCLNDALRELWVVDRLAITAVANQASYDLGTLFSGMGDWLDPQAILELYGPQAASMLGLMPWGGWDARQDAWSIALDVSPGLSGGQTATVEIARPGNTYLKVAGTTWTDNQDGFVNDTDECLFRPEILAEVALVYAYEALADATEGTEQARWDQKAQRQRQKANVLKFRALQHPSTRPSGSRPTSAPYQWYGDLKSFWAS